jgi:hypothetical protein
MIPQPRLLIIEPNQELTSPYKFFPDNFNIIRLTSTKTAFQKLANQNFSLFVVSTSFSPEKLTTLLEALKNQFTDCVIPLLLVVDLNQPLSCVPGTYWGGKLGLLSSNATKQQTLLTLDTIMSA